MAVKGVAERIEAELWDNASTSMTTGQALCVFRVAIFHDSLLY